MMSISRGHKILWWMLNIFALSVPLSSFLSIRILVLTSVVGIFVSNTSQVLPKLARNSWDLILFIATLLIGLSYTDNLKVGFRVLETSFCFFALPLVFAFCAPLVKSRINSLSIMYLSGLVLGSLIMISGSFLSYSESLDLSKFTFYNLTDPLGFQPTYFAYYLSFGICLLLFDLYSKQLTISINVIIGGILFLFLILMLTASRTAYIGMIFVLSFFILKYLFDETGKSNRSIALLSTFILLVMLLVNFFDLNGSLTGSPESTDYWERFTLWDAALRANPNPLLGVGTGDYADVLNNYYHSQGMTLFAEESYNSHNQFIQLYFSNGILGLIALCIIIFRPLYLSFRAQNPLGILIIFPFIIYGITEVFLGRFQGVVFFVFCHQFVIAQCYLITPKLDLGIDNTAST